MSKQRLVQKIQPGNTGPFFGQNSSPSDLMLAQQYAHEHIEHVSKDFLLSQNKEVAGFDYALGEGNEWTITVFAGRAYDANGLSFGSQDTTLDIDESDELPRIDLVYAQLEADEPALPLLIPFTRLRTTDELSDDPPVPPYPPTQYTQPTEKWNKATVQIRKGTAVTTPSIPALNSGEVALYAISVGADVDVIRDKDVLDLRLKTPKLRKLNDDSVSARRDITSILKRLERVETIGDQTIDLTGIFGSIKSLNEVISLIWSRLLKSELPEVTGNGKIQATGNVDGGTPCVDIELSSTIKFGETEIVLHPQRFAKSFEGHLLHPRYAQVSGGAATQKVETALTLDNVTLIDSDGDTDFLERAASFAAARSQLATAARNSSLIEAFGGLAANNGSRLGDWYTYNTANDTLTPRTFSGTIPPSADRPAMFPCGNGTHVLLVCGRSDTNAPRWFYVNASSGASTEKTGTIPSGDYFFGDLIAPNKVFIVAVKKVEAGYETKFWLYDVTPGTFTELGVSGNVPSVAMDYGHGCCFGLNQFVLVKFTPGVSASGETYIFDYPSLTWTKQNLISQPYFGEEATQLPISRFQLACINGRPMLSGGILFKPTDSSKARIWELRNSKASLNSPTRLTWIPVDASFTPVQSQGFSALLSNGLPLGKGFLFGGQGKFSDSISRVYASVTAGLEATSLDGEDGITVAESSSFATFVVNDYEAPFEAIGYHVNLAGLIDLKELIKVEVSFDNGGHYHVVDLDKLFEVSESSDPSRRRIKITMYSYRSIKPVLTKLTEIFDEDGDELDTRIVLRYNSDPDGVRALYVNSGGMIFMSDEILPSTPDVAILHKVTPDGSSAPEVKTYINKRRPRATYIGTAGGGSHVVAIDNELAVEASDVFAVGVDTGSDDKLYRLDDEYEFGFDETVTISLRTNGDGYIVKLEG